jgi:cystathionine beta-lyase/cystathionine gamma-synthase
LEGGSHAVCFASGMAAISACFECIDPVAILFVNAGYTGTKSFIASSRFGQRLVLDAESLVAAAGPRVIYCEAIENPTSQLADIASLAMLRKECGSNCLLIVDATFATPVLCQPLKDGADIVVHSLSKVRKEVFDWLFLKLFSSSSMVTRMSLLV